MFGQGSRIELAVVHNETPLSFLFFAHNKTFGRPLGGRTRLNPTTSQKILHYLLLRRGMLPHKPYRLHRVRQLSLSRAAQRGRGGGGKRSRRPVKENMNKNKTRIGEENKKKNREGSRERDDGAAQKETTGKKKEERWHGATEWNNRGQEEATQQRAPKDWVIHSRGTQ